MVGGDGGGGTSLAAAASAAAAGLRSGVSSPGAGAAPGAGGVVPASAAALLATRPAMSANTTLPTLASSSPADTGASVKATFSPGCSIDCIANSRSTCWLPSFSTSTRSVPDTATLASAARLNDRLSVPPWPVVGRLWTVGADGLGTAVFLQTVAWACRARARQATPRPARTGAS